MRLIDLVLNAKINIILCGNKSKRKKNQATTTKTKSNEKGSQLPCSLCSKKFKKEGKEQSKQVKMKTRLKCLTYKLICASM